MKKNILLFLLCGLYCSLLQASLTDGAEYYILNDYYGKVLGTSEDGSTPRLSKIGLNKDSLSYVFIAEKSSQSGYYYLRLKSTGKYLAANSSNAWGVVYQTEKGSGDAALWALDVQFGRTIVNKRSSSKCLGCDWTRDDYVGVYYDKTFNSLSRFSVFPAKSEGYDASLATASTDVFVNEYGNQQKDIYRLTSDITLSEPIDLHLLASDKVINGGTIDLTHEKAWVIFENVRPSMVEAIYLQFIKVNGKKAVNGRNVRVAIFLDGAAVIPSSSIDKPFVGYTDLNLSGNEVAIRVGNTTQMGAKSNTLRSFLLKRGHMVTLATGEFGKGYSRVYVADHQDVVVNILPEALDRRISSIYVKKWQYTSKKGWCSTKGNESIYDDCNKMKASWFYTWSADRSTTIDYEYIPIWQHLYWPSLSQIGGHTESTAVLGFNEPEHAEQHTSSQCSCGGVIDEWKACTKTPDLLPYGMRIGSPAPTDAGWLYNYIGHCDDMSYRCDFVVMHCYWGTNEANGAQAWYNRLKEIYDRTKRPIWITEWGYGASWTTESWPDGYSDKLEKNRAGIMEIVNMLESCPFVERYSFYNWDSYYRACINTDDGWVTPAGEVYRDTKSTFAYNADVQFVPVWWKPSVKKPEISAKVDMAQGKFIVNVVNGNGDATAELQILHRNGGGEWLPLQVVTERSGFESTTFEYAYALEDIDYENERFKVVATTIYGGTAESDVFSFDYLKNPNIEVSSKSDVPGWTCVRSAENGYTVGTGDTYLEVWAANPAGEYFDYYQTVEDIPNGVYELSAVCFNSSNGVTEGYVNGNVGLYAIAEGVEYFSAVTEDSEINYEQRTVIPQILVRGGKLQVGIKNIGPMTARWAGADDFSLRYLGTEQEILGQDDTFLTRIEEAEQRRRSDLMISTDGTLLDASELFINPRCQRGESYGWTVENLGVTKGESYNGDNQNQYWDQWKASNLSSSMSQTLTKLPIGHYTLSVMLRSSTNVDIELKVTQKGTRGTTAETIHFTGTGNTSAAGSEYKNGWQKVVFPAIDVLWGDSLTVDIKAKGNNSGAWWSVDEWSLLYENQGGQSIKEKMVFNDLRIVNHGGGCVCLVVGESKVVPVYTIDGRLFRKFGLQQGENKFWLPQGMYVIDGRKIMIR